MPRNIKNKLLLDFFQNHAQCGKCFQNCTKNSGTILCKLCNKWYHVKCQNSGKKLLDSIYKEGQFIFEKCVTSFMPFLKLTILIFSQLCLGKAIRLVNDVNGTVLMKMTTFTAIHVMSAFTMFVPSMILLCVALNVI